MWYDDDDKHEIKEMIIIKKWYPKKKWGFQAHDRAQTPDEGEQERSEMES